MRGLSLCFFAAAGLAAGCDAAAESGPDAAPAIDAGVDDAPAYDATATAAPLCGPPDAPCAVLRDEIVSGVMTWRNGYPSLALDPADGQPHILYSVAENGSYGWHARPGATPGSWDVEPLPADTLLGGLAFDPGGTLIAQVRASDTALLAREPTGWRVLETSHTVAGGYPAGLAFDDSGALHAVLGQDTRFAYGVRSEGGGWDIEPLGDPELVDYYGLPSLALADGGAQTFYWEGHNTPEPDWVLMWKRAGEPAEDVMHLGFSIKGWSEVGFAATASGQPHLLAERFVGDSASELVWSTRRAPGDWSQVVVARGDVHPWFLFSCGWPEPEGQTCAYDFTTYRPLAVAARGEDVRLLFVRYHPYGELVSTCDPECGWRPVKREVDGELLVAWRSGDAVEQAVVLDGITPEGGMAVVDGDGRIHLAVYDGGLESWDMDAFDLSRVRYLVLGVANGAP